MSSMNGWASVPTGTGAIGVPRPRCVRPIAGVAIAGMLVAIGLPLAATSASAVLDPNIGPAAPHSIITFPTRDFVHLDGYAASDSLIVNVVRGGIVVGTSERFSPVADPKTGLMVADINHLGSPCWVGVTPDIRGDDVVQVLTAPGVGDQTPTANVVVTQPAAAGLTAGTVTIKGTAVAAGGGQIPIAQLESRVVANQQAFVKSGTRTLRADSTGTADGTLAYVGTSTNWVATWSNLVASDVTMAVATESRGMWLGRNPLALNENTIAEVPSATIPVGPAAGCAALLQVGPVVRMTAASDFGTSQTDGVTNTLTPTFFGSTNLLTATSVNIHVDGSTAVAATATVVGGSFTTPALTQALTPGPHMIRAGEVVGGVETLGSTSVPIMIDNTPATVTGAFPAANATGTRMTGNVTATFSEAVDPTTVTPATFTLMAGATPVPAVTTFNPATKVVTLDPSAALALGTQYTATLTAGVKDAAGNPMVATSWSFTTASSQVASYINRVYSDLFNRTPDPSGLASWSARLNSGTPRIAVANAITGSPEYRSTLITGVYLKYLGRAPDAAGMSTWLAKMSGGFTVSRIEAGFISSPEYFAKAGGTSNTWVFKLYSDVLGRVAGQSEVQFQTSKLAAGVSRNQVAMGFLLSTERLSTVVNGYYQKLLGRALDPAGLATWVKKLQAGQMNETIIGGIIASPEYFAKN